MAISDRREITFDAAAILLVMSCSGRMAATIGLPPEWPIGVAFDPDQASVILDYGSRRAPVPLGSDPMGALLIAYCMRVGIRLPRHVNRGMRIERDAVVLVFSDTHPIPPRGLAPERAEPARVLRDARLSSEKSSPGS